MRAPLTSPKASRLRIAVCGASSTGKSTLVRALVESGVLREHGLRVLALDERAVLRRMGCRNTGCMSADLLRTFQLQLLEEKVACEQGQSGYICEHSYVDMAAYWSIRDASEENTAEDEVVSRCRMLSARYELHIVLPFGAIPFEADGYRSQNLDLHGRIARRISELLCAWGIAHAVLAEVAVAQRVIEVRRLLQELRPT